MKSRFFHRSYKVAFLHIGAWLTYILLYSTLWSDQGQGFKDALIYHLSLLPVKVILVYTSLLFLIPGFLMKKKYYHFIFGLIILTVSGALLNQFYVQSILHTANSGEHFWDLERLSKRFTYLNSPLLFALAFEGVRLNAQLSTEKLNAELALLKNQLQPHFFFNTLNNLYSLVLQKSDLAPDLVLKLSDMMRYIVYESNQKRVTLSDEINFIVNFIAIEKIRYGKKVIVEVNLPKTLPMIELPPLLLFTFIENAFKHGVSHEIEEALIQMNLTLDSKYLDYRVMNSKPAQTGINRIQTNEGVGIKNIRQRLQLIYGDNFKFSYTQTTNSFEGHLRIPI